MTRKRAVQIDEHGDVVVAALGRRLVETERGHAGEIEPGHGLPDIVLDDAPQPLIGDAASTGISRASIRAACSNKSVNRLPSRAQGTWTRFTPSSGQVVRVRTKPYTPRTNGKPERFIQSTLHEWAYAKAYPNSGQRAQAPTGDTITIGTGPHAGIKGCTPISRSGSDVNNLMRLQT